MALRHILVALLSLSISGAKLFAQPSSTDRKQFRAFEQQERADLVLVFRDKGEIHIEKPEQAELHTWLTQKELSSTLDHRKLGRSMVVIILDKRMARAGMEFSLDALASDFHKLGFRRVVIQQAQSSIHPDGLPILLDSTIDEPSQERAPPTEPRS